MYLVYLISIDLELSCLFNSYTTLLQITKIVLATFLVLILVGGKPIIKSIINFNIGPCRIESTNNLLYRRCLDIYTLWHVLYLNI